MKIVINAYTGIFSQVRSLLTQHYIVWGVTLALVLLVLWQSYKIGTLFWSQESELNEVEVRPEVFLTLDTPHIADLHLFGVKPPTEIAETRLNFRLQGIFQASEGKPSFVLIQTDNSGGKVYREGDTLPQNVQVYQIQSDRVILQRQGQLETLLMNRNFLEKR